jgi:acyl carrier protein
MSVSSEVKEFIASELAVGREVGPMEPDTDLLATGIIDSHGVMELVQFLEHHYGVSISDEELTPENFQSLARIEEFVTQKQG